ncbi:hypothetical protein [Aquabacterium sp. OR-4]|uniref:hypothetical protein n=1 Tax=Aquabacterium sp. OR-4 TaxID=2978127 RepID=UPI0021B2956C|nr:hypothetical protein [Aquabacterium sp. OR-4]MDT7835036.1 hypothetical protein [Aquabacterium sp. OR-4]
MFHPLIRLLASKPHLVAQHLGGYVELASAQAQEAARSLQGRLVWSAGAVAGLSAGTLLGGVAALLAAALPVSAMPAPWLLLVGPALPLAAGAGCAWMARRRPVAWTLAPMREQLAADAALFAEADPS